MARHVSFEFQILDYNARMEVLDINALCAACRAGDRRAAARLISLLESPEKSSAAAEAVSAWPLPRQTIGFTGPPGAGKSTLIEYAAMLYRARQEKLGILAIDPSSPFSGGALLGDRVRMAALRNDSGVFIRSMGSRGAAGGIAAAASDSLRVLAAAGFQTVLLETVGAGQAETEIVNLADTVCVVQVPGLGDDVQLMKMGVLEIADVFVVNKGDRPEAAELKAQLELMLDTVPGEVTRALRQLGKSFSANYRGPRWKPPVVLLSALKHSNGLELLAACDAHHQFRQEPLLAAALTRHRLGQELVWRAARKFEEKLSNEIQPGGSLAPLLEACGNGSVSLDAAARKIVE